VSGREVAGVLAAAAPLGMPSGKIGHHPGWKPLQGSTAIMSQAGLQARAGSPDPLRGTVCASLRRVFTDRRNCNEHPLPSASKCVQGRVCGAFPKRVCWFFDWGNICESWFLGILGI
jgi:hypothetical protein